MLMRAFAALKPKAEVAGGVFGGVAVDAGTGGLTDAVAKVFQVWEDLAGEGYLLIYGDFKHIDD